MRGLFDLIDDFLWNERDGVFAFAFTSGCSGSQSLLSEVEQKTESRGVLAPPVDFDNLARIGGRSDVRSGVAFEIARLP